MAWAVYMRCSLEKTYEKYAIKNNDFSKTSMELQNDVINTQRTPSEALYYKSRLSVGESTTVSFMSELLKLRDNYLYFSGDFHLDQVDIATLIDYVATSTV